MSRPRRGRGRAGGRPPRPARRAAAALCAIAVLAGLTAIGCSAASRQRLAEALFDDPPSKRRATAEEAQKKAPEAGKSQPQRRVVRRPVWQGSEHGPFAARLCQACHVPPSGENPAPGAEIARLRLRPEELCLSCHEPRTFKAGLTWGEKVRWHGPVAAGLCLACHLPHRSREQRLLRTAPERLCLGCHAEGHLTAPAAPANARCLDCHDPHAPLMVAEGSR